MSFKLRDIFGIALWVASTVKVFGYTWNSFKAEYQAFGSIGGGGDKAPPFDPLAPFKAAGDIAKDLAPGSTASGAKQLTPGDPARSYTKEVMMRARAGDKPGTMHALRTFIAWERANPQKGWDDIGVAHWVVSNPTIRNLIGQSGFSQIFGS